MTTKEAFKFVVNQRDCHKRTGISYSNISKYRKWCDELGQYQVRPTIDLMEKVITQYGLYKVVKEIWI
jgi:hypothetical protein